MLKKRSICFVVALLLLPQPLLLCLNDVESEDILEQTFPTDCEDYAEEIDSRTTSVTATADGFTLTTDNPDIENWIPVFLFFVALIMFQQWQNNSGVK